MRVKRKVREFAVSLVVLFFNYNNEQINKYDGEYWIYNKIKFDLIDWYYIQITLK